MKETTVIYGLAMYCLGMIFGIIIPTLH